MLWADLLVYVGLPVLLLGGSAVLRAATDRAVRADWARRQRSGGLDGVDEHGMFSPHEFMLANDEVYREIDAAAQRRVRALAEAAERRERYEEWKAGVEADELLAQVRTMNGDRPYVAKARARAAEVAAGVVSGRARLQHDVTQRDLGDDGRLNGSV